MNSSNVNIPNSISMLRILLAPVLLALAWNRQPVFTVVLAATLLMDFLDGFLARRLKQQTRRGAQLAVREELGSNGARMPSGL
jgi:phosphatidylglycerophosphate synthase